MLALQLNINQLNYINLAIVIISTVDKHYVEKWMYVNLRRYLEPYWELMFIEVWMFMIQCVRLYYIVSTIIISLNLV